MKKVVKKLKTARRVTKQSGLTGTAILALQRLQERQTRTTASSGKKHQVKFLAKTEDIMKADWTLNPYVPAKTHKKPPYTVNWVISPPGNGGGGGHQNIFRFIAFLEEQGHTCRVFLYSNSYLQPAPEAEAVFRKAYPDTKTKFAWLDGPMPAADAIFATGWETAYPVFNDPSKARRFYFVQDFEPFFYPLGSEYVLAENTYKFNFFGITAGGYLAKKLSRDYGMKCANYDFGAEKSLYDFTNDGKRKEVFFYARPVTARRGFELGIMALERFYKQHPEYTITLAGWDVSDYNVPFPYQNLKSLKLEELSEVYNRCAAALVISLTNMSLLPLELLSCGTIPVVTDGENNRLVSDNPFIAYAHPAPDALADALHRVITKKDLPVYAKKASDSVAGANWETAGKKFEKILKEELDG